MDADSEAFNLEGQAPSAPLLNDEDLPIPSL